VTLESGIIKVGLGSLGAGIVGFIMTMIVMALAKGFSSPKETQDSESLSFALNSIAIRVIEESTQVEGRAEK